MKFEGVRVFRLNFGNFKRGAALTVPGVGIFIGSNSANDFELLCHEFGHILQCRRWGFWVFWRHIAWGSLQSAYHSRKGRSIHQKYWTEWSANRLSCEYFNATDSWNYRRYPTHPGASASKPRFAANNDEFIRNWIDA